MPPMIFAMNIPSSPAADSMPHTDTARIADRGWRMGSGTSHEPPFATRETQVMAFALLTLAIMLEISRNSRAPSAEDAARRSSPK